MLENKEKTILRVPEKEDTEIHNSKSDKAMVLACAFFSGLSLFSVSFFVLKYKWYFGLLYFAGMFLWVVLFFEYFNFSLFRTKSKVAKK